jgi:MoxR-like ATPase
VGAVQDRQVPLDVFVGRAAGVAGVAEVVSRVQAGQPWLVAIEGDPGVGKTALVRRCLARAAGVRVLSARADQAEADLDFGIVDQLLRAAEAPVRRCCPLAAQARRLRRSPWRRGCWRWWETSRPADRWSSWSMTCSGPATSR